METNTHHFDHQVTCPNTRMFVRELASVIPESLLPLTIMEFPLRFKWSHTQYCKPSKSLNCLKTHTETHTKMEGKPSTEILTRRWVYARTPPGYRSLAIFTEMRVVDVVIGVLFTCDGVKNDLSQKLLENAPVKIYHRDGFPVAKPCFKNIFRTIEFYYKFRLVRRYILINAQWSGADPT